MWCLIDRHLRSESIIVPWEQLGELLGGMKGYNRITPVIYMGQVGFIHSKNWGYNPLTSRGMSHQVGLAVLYVDSRLDHPQEKWIEIILVDGKLVISWNFHQQKLWISWVLLVFSHVNIFFTGILQG